MPKTPWFDMAVFFALIAVGSILFGHFEEHKPKWRRVVKVGLSAAIFGALRFYVGRSWAYGFLMIPLVAILIIHAWWLPKHGINGWTGEPRDRYLELVGGKHKGST